MKIYRLPMLLLTTTLLFSCSNKEKQINYGEWFSVSSTALKIKSTNGSTIDPFGTKMIAKYFLNKNNQYSNSFKTDLESYYLNRIETLHKEFDRHYYYYEDETNKTLVTSVKTINDSYGSNEEIYCSDELYNLLKTGVEWTIKTNGYYNFFIGELVSFWDEIVSAICDEGTEEIIKRFDPYYSESQKLLMDNYKKTIPTLSEVESLLTFNDEHKSVIFNALDDVKGDNDEILQRGTKNSKYRPSITPGGIAKGFATDIIKDELIKRGYTDGWLNSGSSSITLLSNPSFEEYGYQNISFVDPRTAGFNPKAAFSIKIYDEANISTSGNYTLGKSYYLKVDDGRIYRHHIVNPFTGDCPQYHSAVTLYSTTFGAGDLDALSTAFVNMSIEDGLAYKKALLTEKEGYDLDIVYIDYDKEDLDKLVITTTSDFNGSFVSTASESRVVYA